ncbi:hypothetical protein ZWY2020_029031, partial [Hordeum vulgare]
IATQQNFFSLKTNLSSPSATIETVSDGFRSTQEIALAARKGDDAPIQAKIQFFIPLTKMAKKQWKKIKKKSPSADWLEQERSLLQCFSHPHRQPLKQIAMSSYNKWYLVSNKFHKKRLPSNKEQLWKLEFRCS